MSGKNRIAAAEAGGGNFGGCLVEGSIQDKKRGREIKRRAIAVSIVLQSAGLAALVIAPMLAKPAEPAIVTTMPIPPFSAPRSTPRRPTVPIAHTVRRPCV